MICSALKKYLFCMYFYLLYKFLWCCILLLAGDSEPVKMFERTANLVNNQIINYKCDPSEKWLVLIGIAPGAPEVCGCPIMPSKGDFFLL